MSAPSLCSALAMALSSALSTMPAAFFCVNFRMSRACSTFLPRIRAATSRPLSADRRTPRTIDFVSIVVSLLLHGLLVRRMALEQPGRRELAELVADHLARHLHRDGRLAVVRGGRHA